MENEGAAVSCSPSWTAPSEKMLDIGVTASHVFTIRLGFRYVEAGTAEPIERAEEVCQGGCMQTR